MGHLSARTAYQDLQQRVDNHVIGFPATETMFELLRTLYTEDQAALAARLPLKFSSMGAICRKLNMSETELAPQLERLCEIGLAMDLHLGGKMRYMLMPSVVGFVEFSMMRVHDHLDQKKVAEIIHRMTFDEPEFTEQFTQGGAASTSPFRTMVHEDAMARTAKAMGAELTVEIADWERARHLVAEAGKWGVGTCHCRHVQHHTEGDCKVFPMEDSCLTLGKVTEFLDRRGFIKRITKEEALELIDRSRDAGLIHTLDNVKQKPTFLCNCCGCCCEVLGSFKRWGLPNAFSSNYEAAVSIDKCRGCKKCEKACPVDAIKMIPSERQVGKYKIKRLAVIDRDVCLGCGVCQLACRFESMTMVPRPQRRLTPENTMSRVLTMALERGKLPDLMIDPDGGFGAQAASALFGAILKLPPAKQLLARDTFKSRFINFLMTTGEKQGIKSP